MVAFENIINYRKRGTNKITFKFKIMPQKQKELKESKAQVFNLDNMNPALLPELATFKEIS
jgi:hypothetical protein